MAKKRRRFLMHVSIPIDLEDYHRLRKAAQIDEMPHTCWAREKLFEAIERRLQKTVVASAQESLPGEPSP
jgi:hypothetical protein